MTISLLSHALLITSLFNILLPASCIGKLALSAPRHHCSKVMLMDGETRLGSTPPSCHNRCNACSPCTATQVPPPSPAMFRPGGDQPEYSKEYNYKPLGWKCRCRDHLYNP